MILIPLVGRIWYISRQFASSFTVTTCMPDFVMIFWDQIKCWSVWSEIKTSRELNHWWGIQVATEISLLNFLSEPLCAVKRIPTTTFYYITSLLTLFAMIHAHQKFKRWKITTKIQGCLRFDWVGAPGEKMFGLSSSRRHPADWPWGKRFSPCPFLILIRFGKSRKTLSWETEKNQIVRTLICTWTAFFRSGVTRDWLCSLLLQPMKNDV